MSEFGSAVIFDLDGTLLDTLDDLRDAANLVIGRFGFPPRERDEIRNFVGEGARKLVERAMYSKNGELDVKVENPSLTDECFCAFKAYYSQNLNIKTSLYVGVLDLMRRLDDKGIAMAVVSNKPDVATKSLCETHFGGLLRAAVGDREGCRRKPYPDSIIEVMSAIGCKNAVYVGDSEVDVLTAKNAGLPSVLVTWGFRDKDFLIMNGAENLADDCKELEEKIYALLGVLDGEN